MYTRLPSRVLALSAALFCLANPSVVYASYTSTVVGTAATMVGDTAGDTLIISQSGGVFRHNRFGLGDPGFVSDADFDSAVAGEQTVSSTIGIITITAGDGDDRIILDAGVDLRGGVDGGAGTDSIEYQGGAGV